MLSRCITSLLSFPKAHSVTSVPHAAHTHTHTRTHTHAYTQTYTHAPLCLTLLMSPSQTECSSPHLEPSAECSDSKPLCSHLKLLTHTHTFTHTYTHIHTHAPLCLTLLSIGSNRCDASLLSAQMISLSAHTSRCSSSASRCSPLAAAVVMFPC